ncbi:MAG TPA: divalent-cation tolerance protein CutA [Candidatus Binatia bacterium]|nr:divalent-cation tolerance protein CutA [Candidatus Binatia bacterium]
MTDFVVVLVTVGSAAEGERIAETLVREQLAACVNVVGPIRSIYTWKGELQRDDERLLVIKTRAAVFDELDRRVRALHSYETPEVIALPISAGSPPYLDWLATGTHR